MEIRKLMALRVLTMCLVASGTHVQASSFRAQVPFAFVVGSQTFPAGSYIVQRLFGKILESTGVVVIKTSDRRIYRAIITHLKVDRPKDRVGVSKLSFTTFRGQHYLSRIQTADYVYNFHLSGSATLAAAVKPHDTVSVSVSGGSK